MSLRLKMDETGQVTLFGLQAKTARWIIAAAQQYNLAHPPRGKPEEGELAEVIAENNRDNQAWHEGRLSLCTRLGEQVRSAADADQITLAGIDCRDFRSLLTSAGLYYYDLAKKEGDEIDGYKQELKLLKYLDNLVLAKYDAERTVPPKTVKERLREVKEARKERLLIEEIVNEAVSAA